MEKSHAHYQPLHNKVGNLSIVKLLSQRETQSCVSQLRAAYRLMRKLVESKHRVFHEVWNKNSRSPISYDGHLYFSNFRMWFSGCFNGNGSPHILYNKSERRTNWRIEDALRFESSCALEIESNQKPCHTFNYSPCLFALTSDGWLVRFKQNPVWQTLDKVYLGERYHFKHMQYVSSTESFSLKSIRFCGPGWVQRRCLGAQIEERPFLYLAMFKTAPLKFVVNIGVLKNVWGEDIIDANLSHGMFITMHRRDTMKFYDLDVLIETCRQKEFNLGDSIKFPNDSNFYQHSMYDEMQTQYVGVFPCGLPITLTKAQKPPLLLLLKSCHGMISFGGFPWQVITSECKRGSTYQVVDVTKGTVEIRIDSDVDNDSKQGTFFHEDQSGRIFCLGQHSLKCISLKEDDNRRLSCQLQFKIEVKSGNSQERVSYSGSGRSIKWRTEPSVEFNVIHDIDYDDETELLAVLSSDGTNISCRGCVGLYDNQSGKLIRQFFLNGDFDDSSVWSIFIDRDLILCLSKEMSSSRVCTCKMLRLVDSEYGNRPS